MSQDWISSEEFDRLINSPGTVHYHLPEICGTSPSSNPLVSKVVDIWTLAFRERPREWEVLAFITAETRRSNLYAREMPITQLLALLEKHLARNGRSNNVC